ncbi:MAG: hypothetical protein KF819_09795 [Labilithrix sp.]|nr:hypothetical protein [Labilithrix sp.]
MSTRAKGSARPLVLAIATVIVVAAGCSSESEPAPVCTQAVDARTCALSYAPSFKEIFERTLKPSCGLGGAACHTARGRQGGLVFEEEEEAYRGLLDGRARPGDPSCSLVLVRVAATDPAVRMPPGRSLGDEEQCAIARWIADGAKR